MNRARVTVAVALIAVVLGATVDGSSGAAGPPPPRFAHSVDIGLISGVVIVRPVGRASFRLGTQDRSIPVGSELDTRHGKVDLRSAPGPSAVTGTLQDAQFSKGLFVIRQRRNQGGLTQVDLRSALNVQTACAAASTAGAARLNPRVLARLRVHDTHGRFETRGKYSAATVRGTLWDTIDQCDGTLTVVYHGTVFVDDFRLHKTITVHAGHRYLALAP